MLDGEWRLDRQSAQWKLGPGACDLDGTSWQQPATGLAEDAVVVGVRGDWHSVWDMPLAREFGPEAEVARGRLEQSERVEILPALRAALAAAPDLQRLAREQASAPSSPARRSSGECHS